MGAVPLLAQGTAPSGTANASNSEKPARGLAFNERFEGSTDGSATLLDLNTSAGYNLSQHFGFDVGVPIFFVLPKTQSGVATNTTGFGNVYLDLHTDFDIGPVSYGSSFTAGVPTGSVANNLSTGRVMVDWDNRFDHSWGRLTPYLDVDPGNGINNLTNPHQHRATPHRPFITLGTEVQIEAGADVQLASPLTVTGSIYDVAPWGAQTVYSGVLKRGQTGKGTVTHGRVFDTSAVTQGSAALVSDQGFNASVNLKPKPFVDLSAGYSRSMSYAYNTFSFGVAFNMSPKLRHAAGR
jgi:hypothetical protein